MALLDGAARGLHEPSRLSTPLELAERDLTAALIEIRAMMERRT